MAVFTSLTPTVIAGNPTLITDALLPATAGLAFDISSLSVVGGPDSIGLYDGSLTPLGIGAGLLITSGRMPGTANTAGFFGVSNGMAGDPMLNAVVNTVFPTLTYDATTISVNFNVTDPTLTGISFNIVFGSDEYPEWVNQFVDIAAIWVNGTDVAYFNNDPKAPLSIIGSNLAANYFIDNTANLTTRSFGGVARPGIASTLPIEYDGVSAPLTVSAPVHLGLNTLKIGIADTGDHIYDSGLFISGVTGTTLPVRGITLDVDGTEIDDELQGTDTPENLRGMGGNDDIHGAGGDDIVQAGAGDDFISGDAGNDAIDGGLGTDTASYSGAQADYAITANADGTYTVADQRAGSPDGTDTLINVENAQFGDSTLALATMTPIAHVTAPVGTVPVKSTAPFTPPPVTLPASLPAQAVAASEDGEIVSADLLDGLGVDGSGLGVAGLPATLPAGVSYNAAVQALYLDPSNAVFQALAAGETTTVTVNYTLTSGAASTPASVVFTVTGTNDAPVVSAVVAAAATEGGAAATVNALANASDVDHGAVLTVVAAPAAPSAPTTAPLATIGKHGKDDAATPAAPVVAVTAGGLPAGVTFDAATNGFALDPTNAAYVSLGAGQTATVVVDYGVSDGTAVTAAQAVFTVTGVNNAPVVSGPLNTLFVNEDAARGAYDLAALRGVAKDPDATDKLTVSIDASSLPAGVAYVTTPEHIEPAHIIPAHTIQAGPRATPWGNYVYPTTFVPEQLIPEQITPETTTLSIDPSNAAYQSLAQGEEGVVVVNYTISDGTVSVAAQAILTVNGMNDAPVVSGAATATATEGGAVVTVNALSKASDVDHGSVLSVVASPVPVVPVITAGESANDIAEAVALAAAAPIQGTALDPATLPAGVTFNAAGNSFAIDPTNAAYRYLSAGQTATVTVNYGVTDGFTTTAAQTVFTVIGTNSAPVVSGPVSVAVTAVAAGAAPPVTTGLISTDTSGKTEDALPPWVEASPATTGLAAAQLANSVYMLVNASDVDLNDTLSVTGLPAALPAGITHTYTAPYYTPSPIYYGAPIFHPGLDLLTIDPSSSAFRSLAAGETTTITVNYGVTDGTATVPTSASFTITGVNDAPIVGATTATATEGGAIASVNLLSAAGDPDHNGVVSLASGPVGPLPTGVSYDAATRTLSIDPTNAAFRSLAQGQVASYSVGFSVTDGTLVTAANAVLSVVGVNNAPVVIGAMTNTVDEDGNTSANISPFQTLPAPLVSDADTPLESLRVVGLPAALPAGVTFNAGTQKFFLDTTNAAYQVLSAGETKDVSIAFGIFDGYATTAATATYTVVGRNDIPVVSGTVNGGTVTDQGAPVSINLLARTTDIDHLDVLSVVQSKSSTPTATVTAGTWASPIAFSIVNNQLQLNPTQFAALGAGETLSLAFNYTVTDGTAAGTVPASAQLMVMGQNNAPASLTLSSAHVLDHAAAGTVVGQLSAADPDRGDTVTYQIVNDPKGWFAVSGNNLVVAAGAAIDFATAASDAISVKATDAAGASVTSAFTVAIDKIVGVTINGSGGNDTYTPTSATPTTAGDDTVNGNNGDDLIDGGAGNDILTGGVGADIVNGGDGNDRIIESGSDGVGDTLNGGNGTDTLVLGGSTTLSGFNATASSIEIIEGNGKSISGTSGAEVFDLSGITQFTLGGIGFLDAGDGNNTVTGSVFADDLRAGSGSDLIHGGAGNDILSAGAGNDTLWGDAGNDTLTGGAGADIFGFNGGFGVDIIADFTVGTATGHDVIDFSTSVFATFAAAKAASVQSGKDTVITSGADSVTLRNVTASALVAADFSFH